MLFFANLCVASIAANSLNEHAQVLLPLDSVSGRYGRYR